MSKPREPKPAKLVIGLFMKEKALFEPIVDELVSQFGALDLISRWMPFDYTAYYEQEMGAPLFRRLLAFRSLIKQLDLAGIKLATNRMEDHYTVDGRRRVNIDPGYLLHERFVLASGKNFSHRIYVGQKIYADLTLIYQRGVYKTLPWTYPDYADRPIISFLEQARARYGVDLERTSLKTEHRTSNVQHRTLNGGSQTMIKSMTGYAAAETTAGAISVSADMRAYNNRHLDIVLRIPPTYMVLEEKIKGLVNERIARGRVEIRLQIKDESEQAVAFEIDRPRAQSIYNALTQLKAEFQLGNDIQVEHLLSLGGIIKPVEPGEEPDSLWTTIRDCLAQGLDQLDSMRRKEGDFIAVDLTDRLDYIEANLSEIKSASGTLLQQYQEKLAERIAALTRETVEIDPGRLAQEAAFLADRSDISEEIVRAESHVKQFRHIMKGEEPGGRKLNFLLQELNREFNTIGAKIGHADTSHKIVDIKSELEKIREQIQNIE